MLFAQFLAGRGDRQPLLLSENLEWLSLYIWYLNVGGSFRHKARAGDGRIDRQIYDNLRRAVKTKK